MTRRVFAAAVLVAVAGCTVPSADESEILGETSDALSNGATYVLKLPKMSGDTGNCVDVDGNSSSNGANVHEWDCNSSDAQRFVAEDMGSGFYRLRHKNTDKCIQVDCPEQSGACMAAGRNITQWTCDGSSWKQWRFFSYNGYYQMQNRNNTGYCLDVQGGDTHTANGTNIALWTCGSSGTTKGNQTVNPVGSSSGGGGSGIAGVISESTFNSWFPNRAYSDIANQSDTTLRKREVAAILANFAHETGDFVYPVEQNTSNYCSYCDWSQWYGCPAGSCNYYGRGWTQLSWNFNYYAAGNSLGYDLLHNPGWVASNASISAQTAAWYWRTQNGPGGYGNNCHDAMNASSGSGGFGATIWHINGSLECGKSSGSVGNEQMWDRVNRYKTYCNRLGVSYGNNLTC